MALPRLVYLFTRQTSGSLLPMVNTVAMNNHGQILDCILLSISLRAELQDPTLMLCLHFEILCVHFWLRGVSAAVCRLPLAQRARATLLPAHGLLVVVASPVAERRLLGVWLWCLGLAAPQHVESSRTRD